MRCGRVLTEVVDRLVQGSLPIDVLTVAGLAVLVLAALHDFAVRTVPNSFAAILLVVGVALRLLNPGSLHWGALAAGVLFGLTFVFWRLGWMGGGDVKLLTAAAMFVPPPHVFLLVSGTALAGGVLALAYAALSRFVKRPRGSRPRNALLRVFRCEQWRLSRRGPLPYAAAIAAGGVIATLHA
ncbi:MAG: A24 family peptidase [Rhodospirillales bacterium]